MGLSRAHSLNTSLLALTLAVPEATVELYRFLLNPWNDSVGLVCSPESYVRPTGGRDDQY